MKMPATLTALLFATAAQAQMFEDLDALDLRLVERGAAQPLDQRLRLAKCPEAVVIDPPALGAVAVRCTSLGWRIRVAIVPAQPHQDTVLVRKGDLVDLSYGGDAFSVSTSATVLEYGVRGQTIRVTSAASGKTMSATVIGPGEVSANR
jgi:flagella basal body P-ring formation protein FlgA